MHCTLHEFTAQVLEMCLETSFCLFMAGVCYSAFNYLSDARFQEVGMLCENFPDGNLLAKLKFSQGLDSAFSFFHVSVLPVSDQRLGEKFHRHSKFSSTTLGVARVSRSPRSVKS